MKLFYCSVVLILPISYVSPASYFSAGAGGNYMFIYDAYLHNFVAPFSPGFSFEGKYGWDLNSQLVPYDLRVGSGMVFNSVFSSGTGNLTLYGLYIPIWAEYMLYRKEMFKLFSAIEIASGILFLRNHINQNHLSTGSLRFAGNLKLEYARFDPTAFWLQFKLSYAIELVKDYPGSALTGFELLLGFTNEY